MMLYATNMFYRHVIHLPELHDLDENLQPSQFRGDVEVAACMKKHAQPNLQNVQNMWIF